MGEDVKALSDTMTNLGLHKTPSSGQIGNQAGRHRSRSLPTPKRASSLPGEPGAQSQGGYILINDPDIRPIDTPNTGYHSCPEDLITMGPNTTTPGAKKPAKGRKKWVPLPKEELTMKMSEITAPKRSCIECQRRQETCSGDGEKCANCTTNKRICISAVQPGESEHDGLNRQVRQLKETTRAWVTKAFPLMSWLKSGLPRGWDELRETMDSVDMRIYVKEVASASMMVWSDLRDAGDEAEMARLFPDRVKKSSQKKIEPAGVIEKKQPSRWADVVGSST